MKFTILGEPVPKGAMKAVFAKGFMHKYVPAKTRNAMADMRAQIVSQLPAEWQPYDCPLALHIQIYKSKPKSAKKTDKWPSKRPDTDNYLKTILDAMNTVVFKDDALVCYIEATKMYDEKPRVEIWIDLLN